MAETFEDIAALAVKTIMENAAGQGGGGGGDGGGGCVIF